MMPLQTTLSGEELSLLKSLLLSTWYTHTTEDYITDYWLLRGYIICWCNERHIDLNVTMEHIDSYIRDLVDQEDNDIGQNEKEQ